VGEYDRRVGPAAGDVRSRQLSFRCSSNTMRRNSSRADAGVDVVDRCLPPIPAALQFVMRPFPIILFADITNAAAAAASAAAAAAAAVVTLVAIAPGASASRLRARLMLSCQTVYGTRNVR